MAGDHRNRTLEAVVEFPCMLEFQEGAAVDGIVELNLDICQLQSELLVVAFAG